MAAIFQNHSNFQNVASQLTHGLEGYASLLPSGKALAMGKSFAIGFVVTTIITGNPLTGILAGSFNATASLIHTLLAPVFAKAIGSSSYPCTELSWQQEVFRRSIASLASAVILSPLDKGESLTHISISFIAGAFLALERNHRSLRSASINIM